jgi:hypothetical protein
MSLLEQLAARLSATADQLPVTAVALAAERLRVATDLLMWVRQAAANPVAVPQLTNATEHLEQAGYAMRVGQDAVAEYLAAIGLGYQPPPPDSSPGGPPGPAAPANRTPAPTAPPSPLRRWWTERVNLLADRTDAQPESPDGAAGTSQDLLRRVASAVGDRERLRVELARVEAPVGLGMTALTPPALRRLATDLLGHEPGPADLAALTNQTRSGVRALLPRMPDDVVSTVLARVCRTPVSGNGAPPHPTDPAVAGAVLAGVLAQRLGRSPSSLVPEDQHA